MTSPKGLDIKFSGRDFEDPEECCERTFMAAAIRDYTQEKLLFAAILNLEGRAKVWFKFFERKPINWDEFKDLLKENYGRVDALKIKFKLDNIRQEERQRVQTYFERLEKWFQRAKTGDLEQQKRFVNGLRPEIRRLCLGKTFVDIYDAVDTAAEIETGPVLDSYEKLRAILYCAILKPGANLCPQRPSSNTSNDLILQLQTRLKLIYSCFLHSQHPSFS